MTTSNYSIALKRGKTKETLEITNFSFKCQISISSCPKFLLHTLIQRNMPINAPSFRARFYCFWGSSKRCFSCWYLPSHKWNHLPSALLMAIHELIFGLFFFFFCQTPNHSTLLNLPSKHHGYNISCNPLASQGNNIFYWIISIPS